MLNEAVEKILKENSRVLVNIWNQKYMGIADEDLGKVAEQILSIVKPNSDTPPKLNKHYVSCWVELAELQPNELDNIVLLDKRTKVAMLIRYKDDVFPSDAKNNYKWFLMPPCH